MLLEGRNTQGEVPTPNPVSGGTNGSQQWQAIPVTAAVLILSYMIGCLAGEGRLAGGNWMTREHRVEDGFGVLGTLFDEAGAYRKPFGDVFALQVTQTDETTGAADWGIAFRVCSRGIIDLGCTAYFLEVESAYHDL